MERRRWFSSLEPPPARRCGERIQRIRCSDNETDDCPRCQTGGKLLADRGLRWLLRKDWPRTIDELEALKRRLAARGLSEIFTVLVLQQRERLG